MSKVYICNRCNKNELDEIEKAFRENDIDYGFLCIKNCGNKLRAKKNGEIIIGNSIPDLIEKILK